MTDCFTAREFLNLESHYSVAAIYAEIQKAQDVYESGRELPAHIVISDCKRSVQLEFGISAEIDLENAMHKLDTMIDVLIGFKTELKLQGAEFLAIKNS